MQKGKKFLSDLKLYSDYFKWSDEKNRYETWQEACEDIINGHRKKYGKYSKEIEPYLQSALESMKEQAVLASQRNLQYRHNEIMKHNTRMFNCLGVETEFITDKGVFSFEDFKENDNVNVWTHKGNWKKAVVKKYGKQKLNKITFKYNGSIQTIRATSNHRWILNDGTETTSLKVGDTLIRPKPIYKFDYDSASPFEKLYWCYGYVFGDGSKVMDKKGIHKHSMVRLCGDQIKFAYRFDEMGFKSSEPLSIVGDLIFYTGKYLKTLPNLDVDDNKLIQAFVSGYLDADAEKNNNPYGKKYNNIQSSDLESIKFLRKILPTSGFFLLSEKDMTGQKTNYGIRPKTSKFTITEQLGSKFNKPYHVISIEEDLEEDVWCLEVEDDHSFTLSNGIVTGNCTSGHIARNRIFQEIFYLALSGCGFGGGLLIPFVNNLSKIQKRTKGTKTFVISDSIEGWADSLGVLMSSYFVDNQPYPEYAGYEIKFDYTQIREKGSYISGGFKAPGHDGLKQSLEKIEALLEKWLITEGNKIRPILAFDIICHSADAVLSGGVRRSALNMVVDPNDDEMIHAKTGNWRTENPQRGRSNNSVLLLRDEVTKEKFDYLVKLNDGANDIGFVFANSWFDMFNPCFEILKIPVLLKTDFSKIKYDEVEEFVSKNIKFFGIQGCNLTEINAEKCTTKEKFLKACKDASILGTLQAGYTDFPYLGEVSEQIFERESLLGVSITGWMNNPKLFNAELLEEGANMVKETNKELSFLIDINQAARTTCVKPSGNASVVLGTASGIHPEHSERYFRIMQLNKESNTAKWLEENMSFLIEESVWSSTKSDYVVFVPVENPKQGLFKKDMKGIKHLELIKLVQTHWVNAGTNPELCVYSPVNHNTSCTVIIDDKDAIVDYIWENKNHFTAVSFISDYGDKDFNQAPFTSVLTLEELIASYGKGAVLASGLIVDGLHYFNNNLWLACDSLLDSSIPITGTREQVLLKNYWITRAKKFAKNYFKGDYKKMIYCLKDVHLFHKWETVSRQFKEVNFGEILNKPQYKDISDYASMACSGGQCEITSI